MEEQAPAAAEAHRSPTPGASLLEGRASRGGDSADRRTALAADRTVLAAERTYAAWVRTGLAALIAGVGAGTLLQHKVPDWLVRPTGSLLVFFSAFCFVAAVWREMAPVAPRPELPRIPSALLIAGNGFLVMVCIVALIGIWTM